MKFKAALFDLDGTILDSNWVWEEVDKKCEQEYKIKFEKDYKNIISHMHMEEIAEYTINKYKLKETKENLQNYWIELAEDLYKNKVKLKQGIYKVLKCLKEKNVKMSIVTSCHRNFANLAINNNKISNFFDDISFVEDKTTTKKNASLYIKSCSKLNVKEENCAIFEDIVKPIKYAKLRGFFYFGVYDKYQNEDEIKKLKKNCDHYIENFEFFLNNEIDEFF